MPFTGFAGPEEIKILGKVLDDYCAEHGISAEEERNDIAHRIMGLFKSGMSSAEELAAALRGEGGRRTRL